MIIGIVMLALLPVGLFTLMAWSVGLRGASFAFGAGVGLLSYVLLASWLIAR
jgi:hypothetical protein